FRRSRVCGVVGEGPAASNLYAFWWQSDSDRPLRSPPDLSGRPDLVSGDLFVHRVGQRAQIWLYEQTNGGSLRWRLITVGYERQDGRVFSFTEKRNLPSWLERDWFLKR
ncbi:hypothetical protein BV20DRAFT_916682, partial [Pilatotrama ljubarskyi]